MEIVSKLKSNRITLILLSGLLLVVLLLFRSMENLREAREQLGVHEKFLMDIAQKNRETLKEMKAVQDSIRQDFKNNKIVVVNQETKFKEIEKAPVRTNYTTAELNKWLKDRSSDHK